ncbi:MAG: site-2 protease family protein [Candidatus Micrarchaeota archaeon]
MKKKLVLTALILGSIALFFAIAFSEIEVITKAIILLVLLGVTGWLIQKITGIEGYNGLLVLKGAHGFNLMRNIAEKHGETAKKIADFGLVLGFGLPYGYYLFKKNKKYLVYAAISSLFFIFPWITNPENFSTQATTIMGLALGLFGIGLYSLAQNAFNILTTPGTPAGVSILIPGVTVPYEAIIAIIIIAAVHELAHGVLAYAEKIEIKSSGALLFGFLPIGAFVEPDEKKFEKQPITKKRRVLIAGSTSNFLFFLVFLALWISLTPLLPTLVSGVGITNSTIQGITAGAIITSIDGESFNSQTEYYNKLLNEANNDNKILVETNEWKKEIPATSITLEQVFDFSVNKDVLKDGEVIYAINGKHLNSVKELGDELKQYSPSEQLVLETSNGNKTIFLDEKGRIGANFMQVPSIQFQNIPKNAIIYALMMVVLTIVYWTFLLNFILATVNLLPIFITDGHRIIKNELQHVFGEKGKKIALAISLFVLLLILINALPALNISFPWFN